LITHNGKPFVRIGCFLRNVEPTTSADGTSVSCAHQSTLDVVITLHIKTNFVLFLGLYVQIFEYSDV